MVFDTLSRETDIPEDHCTSKADRVIHLDLKERHLSSVPKEVVMSSSFCGLRVLDLRKNRLCGLPADILSLANLEELWLDGNHLCNLPREVFMLPRLRVLSASRNRLSELSPKVGDLSETLTCLNVGDNYIEEIPWSLGMCTALNKLYIHNNHFAELPPTLGRLGALREVALEWFRYTTPPLPRLLLGDEWRHTIQKFLRILAQASGNQAGDGEPVSCLDVIALLSSKDFEANGVDSKRRTRLHVACLEGHVGVAKALVDSGRISCDSLDSEGFSPLLIAVRDERRSLARAIIRSTAQNPLHKFDISKGGGMYGSPLHVAVVNFDAAMVQLLLVEGVADPNFQDQDGNSPMHVLMSIFDKKPSEDLSLPGAMREHLEKARAIGQLLIDSGADCNKANSDLWSPLHLAARRNQSHGIQFAIDHLKHFDLNLKGGLHKWSALHLAAHAQHVGVVDKLCAATSSASAPSPLDPLVRNHEMKTPRQLARGSPAIGKLIRRVEITHLWRKVQRDKKGFLEGSMDDYQDRYIQDLIFANEPETGHGFFKM